MDHKRGYPYDYMEDQAVHSPTKRLKDLSYHRDFPQVCQNATSENINVSSCRENPQLGERYNAELHRSQYKTQIQFGCPQGTHGHGRQQRQQQEVEASHLPDGEAAAKANAVPPPQPTWNCATMKSATSLEMKMEEVAYLSTLPLVKKELEKWTFDNPHRAPRRMPFPEAISSDEPDDETTCAVCRNPRKFKGWDALLIHAQKYSKQMPWQHRGYFRALQEALFDKKVEKHAQAVAAANAAAAATSPAAAAAAASPPPATSCAGDIKHQTDTQRMPKQVEKRNGQTGRPDILIVENEEVHEVGHILEQEGGGQQASQKPRLREVLAVYTQGELDDEQRPVFVFPASKVGYVAEPGVANRNTKKNESKPSWKPEELTKGGDEIEKSDDQQGAKPSEMVSSPDITNDVATRCESLKEALGLQLTLDDPDDIPGKKLFDLEQIHRTNCVMDRWAENFKSFAQRFEMQRVFRDSPQLAAIDKGFRDDLKRIKKYSPACKRTIKEHMVEIESQFREDHLMWLQQVEEVREQFQELADEAQYKEVCDKFLKMRAELEVTKEVWKHEKEEQHKALRAAQEKAIVVARRRKTKQRLERAQMMQLWMEDARMFKQESTKAREERRRLQKIHDKVHDRAETARKDCPVCLESFRVATQDAAT